METRLDKFGRIVIPKSVRDHLGLSTGAVLYVEEQNHDIILKIADHHAPLKVQDGITVYTAKSVDDIEKTQEKERDERLDKLGGDE